MSGMVDMMALAAAGSVINSRIPPKDVKNQNNKSKKEKTNTRDIYATNNSRATRDDYETKARARYRASRDFKNTKIIPKLYKELDEFNQQNKNKVTFIEEFNGDSDSVYSDDAKTFDSRGSRISRNDRDNESMCSNGSDDGYHGFNQNDPASMLDKMAGITNNRKFESCVAKNSIDKRDKFGEKNTWVNQYEQMSFDNPEGPVASN
jgi:hypothetical protein